VLEAIDVDEGGSVYLPIAQQLLRTLKVTLTLAGATFGRKELLTPDGQGRISVRTRRGSEGPHGAMFGPEARIDEWYDYIRVSLDSATPQGFLLIQDGTPRVTVEGRSRASFQAYYVDGKVEPIKYVAPSGTETDVLAPVDPVVITPPIRSSGYKIPGELQDTYVNGALQPHLSGYPTASRFSGLMRGVAGNYHARGQNIPFAYWWTKTHGLVKMPPTAAAAAAATVDRPAASQYWIVEVSATGIYAAPVTNNGTRNGSWNVTKYMPTAAMIAAQPGLAQYKTSLSLSWAIGALPNSGVVFLSVNMAAAYVGGPFYAGHG